MHQYPYKRKVLSMALSCFFVSFCGSAFRTLTCFALCGIKWNYFSHAHILLVLLGACLLPGFIFPAFAGFCADRIPKRYILFLSSLLDLLLIVTGTMAYIYSDADCSWVLPSAVFLLSASGIFFQTACEAILPELFPETELSRAEGLIEMLNFIAVIAGVGLGMGAFLQTHGNAFVCGGLLLVPASAAILSSISIPHVISAVQRKKELLYHFGKGKEKLFTLFRRKKQIFFAALGDATFIGIAIAVQPLLVLFGKYSLGITSSMDMTLLQLAPLAGMLLGCFFAGLFSGNKTELGLIPVGALGMAVFFPLSVYVTGTPLHLTMIVPHFTEAVRVSYPFSFFWNTEFFLAAAGFCGGLFLIPLRVYFQQRLPDEIRGAGIAFRIFWASFFILFLMIPVFLMALGTVGDDPEIPEIFWGAASKLPEFSPKTLLVSLGFLVFGITLFCMWTLPNFLLRFLILALGHSLCRIRIRGKENIPEHGPCLLLSNHVSVIDSVLISACTSRQIRFLLYEKYYRAYPLIGAVAKLTGFFKVPSDARRKKLEKMFQEIRDFLKSGGIICVYPEGKLTRNGSMSKFHRGYEKMLPDDMTIPVIPVNISCVWGSVFSCFFGPLKMRLPEKLPFFASVTIGTPLAKGASVFEIRQKIAELSAEGSSELLPDEKTLHHKLAILAKHHPFRPFFTDSGGKSLSALDLFLRAVLISRKLRELLSSEIRHVGIMLPNSTEASAAILAVMLADKIPAPLNSTVPEEVLLSSLESASIKHIITTHAFLERTRGKALPQMIFLEDLEKEITFFQKFAAGCVFLLLPVGEFMNIVSPLSAFSFDEPAVLLFSSGSTGTPKGILLSQHNMASDVYAAACTIGASSQDVILGNLPLFHSFGLNVCFWLPIQNGIRTVFVQNPLDSGTICSTIREEKVTLLFTTPSFLQKYLRRADQETFRSVRLVAAGAEKVRKELVRQLKEKTEGRLDIVECYGCTELSPFVTFNGPENICDIGRKSGKNGSIGFPLINASVRILDPLTHRDVPPNTEGILFVRGPMVMKGYLNHPELTEKVMLNGYYETGDVAKMDEEGYLTICGRLSRFSKIAGEMVPHEMVEEVISGICQIPERTVAVGSMPDPVKGEALIVLYTEKTPLSPKEIVEQMREKSISNLWIPKEINFCKVEKLPLLASGKLDLNFIRRFGEDIAKARMNAK